MDKQETYEIGHYLAKLVVALVKAGSDVFLLERVFELLVLVFELDALSLEGRDAEVLAVVAALEAAPDIHVVILDDTQDDV